jgi:16S rRNA (cytosine967-C5)-methyltransferase
MTDQLQDRLLARAAAPGRVRGVLLELWDQGRRGPARAVWAAGLRQARALHSAERRLVQDGLYGLVRDELRLRTLLGTDDPLALWLGWLIRRGLPQELAAAEHPAPFQELARWDELGADLPAPERLALWHSLPLPVVHRLVELLGAERAEQELRAFDARGPVHLRVNRRRGAREQLAQRLRQEGVETSPLPQVPDGLQVSGRANLEGTRAFAQGWFELQDEGSQRLIELLPEKGDILDVCAGAGGKSLALAARGARVTALDIRQRALLELERRAERAGVRIATRLVPEDRLPDDLRPAPAVLVDAPCTGSGVLRRHPEHRWSLSEEQIARKVALQQRLLRDASRLVTPGGLLVYSTCSVLPDEDEQVTRAFLQTQPEFALQTELRTWPHRDGCDGFYAAALRRT